MSEETLRARVEELEGKLEAMSEGRAKAAVEFRERIRELEEELYVLRPMKPNWDAREERIRELQQYVKKLEDALDKAIHA